ncbi:hypothetical protein HOLleu_01666 [Holothuria leucospilota]|uniref:Uncharacterized protein n=1 Tax=Holothuria leucospilota TaxID=206669 RepID=A0A9Q1CQ92_HOLLE|nr:hypothetical protein HOLleu_01666 [Holothuria leucospilota]
MVESDANHRQLLRLLFQVCHIVYTFDDRCCYPLHTLLGEAVHGLGGADELVRILNRFGIISSLSKIRSHELDFMYTKLKNGWNEVFIKGAFCFVSIDNVDKASSHASVKASGGQRGIHATSYQLVEPNPLSLRTVEGETSPESGSESIFTLPDNVTVKDILEIRKQARPTNVAWSRSHTTRPCGRIADFHIKSEEQHAVDETTSALLAYGVIKASSSHPATEDTILPDLNLVCPRPPIPKTEKSKVYYLGVLNEYADKINTIREVIETIHQEVVTQRKMETLIVVGDGKTYFHLVKLKQQYAAELD